MANKKRLIDANALLAYINNHDYELVSRMGCVDKGMFTDGIKHGIDIQPTVDAVEVVHGRWNTTCLTGGFAEEWGYVCSVCGCTVSDESGLGKYQGSNQQLNYCPNCGAKMDGGNEVG